MHFDIYDVFYSQYSHQHVSAGHLQGDVIITRIKIYKFG